MDFKDLTDEQKAKVRECKSPAELIELAKAEGVELSDEQLNAVAGGGSWNCWDLCSADRICPLNY